MIIVLVGSLMFVFMPPTAVLVAQEPPPANFKIAFIGDQGQGPNAIAVLNLIKAEDAQAVMHSGDLDYLDNPAAWDAQINSVLGADFPYFVSIGNHDELAWSGPNGYQHYLENRFSRLGISWSGKLGVRSSFYYNGIFFVLTAPGITNGFDDGGSNLYIKDQLAADNSIWSICSWHKNMRRMQVGGKADETGWEVYEEARKGGAIIATAHEHSYSRTHLLSSMVNQTVASTSNTLNLTKGNTFAFVSGLGGHSVRAQSLTGNWWASAYASTCLPGDQICQPNAIHGALFGILNVDGQPNKAIFYFKDINGRIVDSFVVVSNVETPFISGISPSSVEAGGGAFTLTIDGAGFVNGSVVQWNNLARPTTLISPTRLAATITAADIATAGMPQITVFNPEPGGGTSNAATLTVNNPPPVIATLAPPATLAGNGALTLTINGAGFNTSSVVRFANSDRATTFVSATQLTAQLTAADIATAGMPQITVFNP
ncbi:MAG: IPT/TIG domain-containing protein, partial [Acidobacteriota bacterium]